jgi:cytochrome bd-type quinol oxidase subunit 1
MFANYREAFITVWPLAFLMSVLIYAGLAMFVLIGSAMAQTSKQQMLDNEFYAAIFMVVFVIYNWLAAWYGIFLEERQELMDTLAKP